MKLSNFVIALVLLVSLQLTSFAQNIIIGKAEQLQSKVLGEKRTIYVHVPKNNTNEKYPVLYLLDGGVFLPIAKAMLHMDEGLLPKMIIVGIANQVNRTRDLTAAKKPGLRTSGGGEKFTQFIEKELIPYIDKKYPTRPYRTLAGHSLGGLFTINALVNHSHLFDNYVAIDPSLWHDEALLQKAMKAVKSSGKFAKKSLFVAAANTIQGVKKGLNISNVMQDTTTFTHHLRSVIQFSKTAASQNKSKLNFAWKYYGSESHASVPYPSLYEGLRQLFAWYKIDVDELVTINNPKTDLKTVLRLFHKHYAKLSRGFGYKVLPEEGYINSLGYMYLQTGQPERSEAFFKMNIKYYPKSANVYDSMADYYIAKKDSAKALKYVTKAYKISGNKYHKNRIQKLKAKK